jgi:excinuclease ABC subunit C
LTDGPRDEPSAKADKSDLKAALANKVEGLPSTPGVYLFKDARGKVIYVGKAKRLRERVRSYVNATDTRYTVQFLMDRAADIETLVTVSETEALILENNLIKQYKPRYNVKLKDDKSYVSVKITTKDPWPRILVTRKIVRDGNTYLGPFGSASGLRETIDTIRKVFPLRTCSDTVFRNRSRACLEYQIKRCLAPCVYDVDRVEYGKHLTGATQLLEGKGEALVRSLTDAMTEAAGAERYEEAARIRDRIAAISKVAEKQQVLIHSGGDRDVFGMYREGGFVEAQVLLVRAGKLVNHHAYRFEDYDFPDEELMSSLVGRFYQADRSIPDEVLLPFDIEGADSMARYLGERRGRKVEVVTPKRGERARLVEMATENAAHSFRERNDETLRREKMLAELQTKLHLQSTPKRIECFDISHVQGEAVVASKVAFDEALPDKNGYRRYKLRDVQRNDDFAAMKEVLSRRLVRGRDEGGLPDLLLVDGGKGQLACAVEALRELEIEGVELASIAKDRVAGDATGEEIVHSEERVFRPGRSNPIVLRRNSNALFLLQHIRDEAHRFAITFHREIRSKRRLRSVLDDIPGVGPAKRKALLTHFGSLRRVREAEVDAIAELPEISLALAGRIFRALRD